MRLRLDTYLHGSIVGCHPRQLLQLTRHPEDRQRDAMRTADNVNSPLRIEYL